MNKSIVLNSQELDLISGGNVAVGAFAAGAAYKGFSYLLSESAISSLAGAASSCGIAKATFVSVFGPAAVLTQLAITAGTYLVVNKLSQSNFAFKQQ